ncbi:MAG: HAMP domain-containing sensor histidine kinase [Pseudomonadota bacterium]
MRSDIKLKSSATSLMRRLMWGFALVMFLVWAGILAWVAIEAKNTGIEFMQANLRTIAQQSLSLMKDQAAEPDKLREMAREFEKYENQRMANEDEVAHKIYIQVWKGNEQIYASFYKGHPSSLFVYGSGPISAVRPSLSAAWHGPLGEDRTASGWVEIDEASQITVRAAREDYSYALLTLKSTGYFLLPVLFSFPLLLLPAWLTFRIGLRPLRQISEEIEKRSVYDLTPVPASHYRELLPLVHSTNRLMHSLQERIAREQEFLIDAAHELKTPLAIIQVNADSIHSVRDPMRLHEAHLGLRQGVKRATHAVHQLLELARFSGNDKQVQLQELDLVEMVRERLALSAHLALRRGIDIELQAPEKCILPLNRASMSSLIDNLIDNAVKYSPDRGQIRVSVQSDDQGVRFSVRDEGQGIPAELRKKVFERFFRLPNQDQTGTGLGLAIAEKAAMQNSADITLLDPVNARGLQVVVRFAS